MFNSYNTSQTINNLKFTAVSGNIYKTYKESWFVRFHLRSELMEKLSDHSKVRYDEDTNQYYIGTQSDSGNRWINCEKEYNRAKPVAILQMVICGDMEVIAEIIYKEDLEKNLKILEEKDNEI